MNAENFELLPRFVSTRSLASVVGAAFVLAAAVGWAAAGYDIAELRTWSQMRGGRVLLPADRLALSRAGWIAAAAQVASAGLVAALFLPWLHRVRANLRPLGVRRLAYPRRWTYLGFAVPGLNAFRPYQVVSEVWRASDPATGDPLAWRAKPAPRLVLAWWAGLVAWVSLEIAAALMFGAARGHAPVHIPLGISLAADVFAASSASLGYLIVARITSAQDAKWSAFGGGDVAEVRRPGAPHGAIRPDLGPRTASA